MNQLTRCQTIGDMPLAAQALLDGPGSEQLFTSRLWLETFVSAGLPKGTEPVFLILGNDPSPQAILPCQHHADGAASITGLTSFYSCDFKPIVGTDADRAAIAHIVGVAVSETFRDEAVIGFDSLDSTQPDTTQFIAGLARPGRALLRYAHFGHWWEDVTGKSFTDYMAERGGALREVIRRKGAKLAREGATLTMIGPGADAAQLERGITDYETVYAASWKEREAFPEFQPTLMRNLAAAGWLRLALCHIDGKPIATQLWVLVNGTATVLKLAHDQAFDRLSPGSILTHFAIGRLMEHETVRKLDFGRGDDPYKSGWTTNRSQHIGVLSVSVVRRPGIIVRHALGVAARVLKKRVRPAL
jgi:Acetyltransferase (GNAT) domain